MTPDKIKVSVPQETLTINLPKDVTLENFLKKVDDIVEKDYTELHEKAYADYKDKNPGKSFDDFMNDHLSDLYAKLNMEYGIGVLEQKANISEELKKLNFEVNETVAAPANTSVEQDDKTNNGQKSIDEMKKEFDKVVYKDRQQTGNGGLGIKFDPNRNLSDPVDATIGLKAKNYTNLFNTKLNVSTTDVTKDTKTEEKNYQNRENNEVLTGSAKYLQDTYGKNKTLAPYNESGFYRAWAERWDATGHKAIVNGKQDTFSYNNKTYKRNVKGLPTELGMSSSQKEEIKDQNNVIDEVKDKKENQNIPTNASTDKTNNASTVSETKAPIKEQTEAEIKKPNPLYNPNADIQSQSAPTTGSETATNKDAELASDNANRVDVTSHYKLDTRGNAVEDQGNKFTKQRAALRELLIGRPGELDIVDTDESLSREQKHEIKKLKRDIIGGGVLQWKGIGTEVLPQVFATMKKGMLDGKNIRSEAFWTNQDLDTKFRNDNKESKVLSRIGSLYADYMEGTLSGKYIERFFGLMDETGGIATEAYNNNTHGEVVLKGAEVFSSELQIVEGKQNGMSKEEVNYAKNLIDRTNSDDQAAWFVGLLEDYNLDGLTSVADKGMRGGLSLSQAYRSALVDIDYDLKKSGSKELSSTVAIENLLDVVGQLKNTLPVEQQAALKTLSELSPSQVKEYLSAHPGQLKLLQDVLKNSPLSRKDIFVYGKDAFKESYANTVESYKFSEGLSAQEKKEVDAITEVKWKELYAQGVAAGMDPKILDGEAQHIREHMVNAINDAKLNANLNGVAGVGLSIPMIAKGLSFNISAGATAAGTNVAPVFGISIAYDKNLRAGFRSSSAIGATGLGFIPFASTDITKGRELGTNKLKNSLDAGTIKTITLGAGARVMMFGLLPVFSVGVHAGYERDKIGGIETQYNNIRKNIGSISDEIVKISGTYANKVSEIKSLLIKTPGFTKTSDDGLQTAAENLARGLAYFGDISKDASLQAKTSAMLTEFYALGWKNQVTEALKGGVQAVNIGLDWIVGTMVFIPSLAVTFEKFKSSYYADSEVSRAEVERADNLGHGNELINGKEIGQDEIDLINGRLKTIDAKAPDILVDGNFLKIPVSLAKNINIKLDADSMKGMIRKEGEYLYAPRATTYRLLQARGSQNARTVLNIGDNESDDAVDFNLASSSLKDPTLRGFAKDNETLEAYKARVEKEFTTEGKITLNTLNKALSSLKTKDVNFPTLTATVSGDGFDISLDGKVTHITKAQNLIVTKKDATYTLSTSPVEVGKSMQVVFSSEAKAQQEIKPYDESITDTSFTGLDTIDTTTSDALRNLEHSDKANGYKEYHNFMDALIAGDKETVDVDKAYIALTALLAKAPNVQISQYITDHIEKGSTDKQRNISLLVHKMALVMSQSPRYESQTLAQIVAQRSGYDKLPKTTVGLDHAFYKANIYTGALGEKYDTTKSQPVKNMIGYSAFYRANRFGGSEETKGFSLAPLGDVRVYNNMQCTLDAQQSASAKNFIVENLKRSPTEIAIIAQQYQDKINTILKAKGQSEIKLSNDDVYALLTKGSIPHHDCGTITFDTSAIAYAQGECCNQGIGLQINKINVAGTNCTVDVQGKITEIKEDVSIESVGGGKLYLNDVDMAAQARRDANRFTLGWAARVSTKKETHQIIKNPEDTDGGTGNEGTIDPEATNGGTYNEGQGVPTSTINTAPTSTSYTTKETTITGGLYAAPGYYSSPGKRKEDKDKE